MAKNLTINKVMWVATSSLVLLASTVGILKPSIYEGVVAESIVAGVFTQDLVALVAAVVVIILALSANPQSFRKFIVIIGIFGFFFYAYGIYAMEQVYNWFYPIYLAIFSGSTFSIALSLASLDLRAISSVELPGWLRWAAALYGILIAFMFNFLWLGQLIPLLQAGDRIEHTFSIFIIDLCFVMPAFVITAVKTLRSKPLGEVGLPALFVLGVGILSPLALAELIKPTRYSLPMDVGQFALYLFLSISFGLFATVYLTKYSPSRQ